MFVQAECPLILLKTVNGHEPKSQNIVTLNSSSLFHCFILSLTRLYLSSRLEVWPGYITAISEQEGGLLLLADASHRVLRTETVLDVM